MGLFLTDAGIPQIAVSCILIALLTAAGFATEPCGSAGLRIAAYNVENYLLMPRRLNGKLHPNAGKPETERDAVARMIGSLRPDVLGVMEMGQPAQFEDLRKRLRRQGLEYPHAEYLEGADTARHVVLLSRFPFVEKHSLNEVPLRVNGVTLHSPRGFIDVTVEPSPGERLRILCVHLKAKLEVAEYDQNDLRNAEAEFLRRHVRDILHEDPTVRLVVMGDFNDTKNENPIWHLLGKPVWPDSLTALPLADDRGEFWTEYWAAADVYSRIDYIMVSKKLVSEIDPAQSGIARPPFWNEASDHCPVFMTLKNPFTSATTPPKATP